ncbi:hypothetical protein ACN42_g8279 [Penicillium freii]|uniref:Xylulose 5-phosphate/Fructose 6-phosphate phosphoketolase N-terminal domain-containing protein n=1 Tax=Penicillium freii TaxID=48697 RepID=A0A117NM89_PENFR|nr:hypothetical protein ACN42_g8279 [Penicillium freii]
MAAAGGASSIITQVQQTGGPPINTLGDIGGDEHVGLDLRGTRFTLSRDELLTLPEFVLLSLFPNGLLPDGHSTNGFHDGDVFPVDYDPISLQYMLDFFRTVAQTIPSSLPSGSNSPDMELSDPMQGSARDMLQDRAGIIVLREDLDFYVIPPRADIGHDEMLEVKRAAGRSLLRQDGIFSGLRKSEEIGSTEQHLIEMLTAGGFDRADQWGHRAPEPNKAVICSLALAKLRTDIRGDLSNNNSVGMAQKLLLFWRKPARRCWWEGIELNDVEGVEGPVKVWIRRVWTLEMPFPHIPFACFGFVSCIHTTATPVHNGRNPRTTGYGHGAPRIISQSYLEGVYSEVYPDEGEDMEGMKKFFNQFSFLVALEAMRPPRHPAVSTRGELGYARSVFDNPDLITLTMSWRRQVRDRPAGNQLAQHEVFLYLGHFQRLI